MLFKEREKERVNTKINSPYIYLIVILIKKNFIWFFKLFSNYLRLLGMIVTHTIYIDDNFLEMVLFILVVETKQY